MIRPSGRRHSFAQITNEREAVTDVALPDEVGQDDLRFGIDRHPDVLIAPFNRNVAVKVTFLGVHKSPKFIGLHESRADVSDFRVKQSTRLFPDREKERKNRSLVDSSDAGNGTDTHALKQERDDLKGGLSRDVVPSKRLLARLRAGRLTAGATIPLDSEASVGSESLCFMVLALEAGHGRFSLVFSWEKPENDFLRVQMRASSAFEFALLEARTSNRAFLFRSLFYASNLSDKFAKSLSEIDYRQFVGGDVHRLNLISDLFLSSSFNFSLLLEACEYSVDRSEQIPISASVEPDGFEMHPHLFHRDRGLSYSVKRESNCIRQSETSFNVRIFLPAEFSQNRYALTQIAYSLFEFLSASLSFAQLADGICEFFFCFVKC